MNRAKLLVPLCGAMLLLGGCANSSQYSILTAERNFSRSLDREPGVFMRWDKQLSGKTADERSRAAVLTHAEKSFSRSQRDVMRRTSLTQLNHETSVDENGNFVVPMSPIVAAERNLRKKD